MSLAAVAEIGHNNPPSDPFTAVRINCEDLYAEAKHWLDGAEITSDAEAEAVGRLLEMAREAFDAADAARIMENEPFDTGKAAVQEKYAPLIADTKKVKGTMVRMKEACLAALKPWREKKLAEAAALAETARQEAARKAQAAADAIRASAGNLDATEAAEDLVKAAVDAQRDAARATKATTTGTGLSTYFEAVMTVQRDAILFYMKRRPEAFVDLCKSLAAEDVRAGIRTIPGFAVEERRRAR